MILSLMSKIEKLLDKVKNNSHNVRFDDICKLAEAFGFQRKGGKGVMGFTAKKVLRRF